MGRPTDYKPDYVDMAYRLGLLGLTDKQIAEAFDVNERTLHRWKKKHPEFCQSLKQSKINADAKVAESLYQAAIGHDVTRTVIRRDGEKVTKQIVVERVQNVTAAIFWLKNRQPAVWRDKPTADELVQEPTPVQIVVNTVDASVSDDDGST